MSRFCLFPQEFVVSSFNPGNSSWRPTMLVLSWPHLAPNLCLICCNHAIIKIAITQSKKTTPNWGCFVCFPQDKLTNSNVHYVLAELFAGGMAGAVSWASATPFDVVKSRMQASDQKLRLTAVIRGLYKEEGMLLLVLSCLTHSLITSHTYIASINVYYIICISW